MKALLLLALFPLSVFAQKITVGVEGMHCANCVGDLEELFKKVPEVKSVKGNFKNSNVVLETEGTANVADEKIKGVITEAGFRVAKIQRAK